MEATQTPITLLKVTRKSPFSGEVNTIWVTVPTAGLVAYKAGALIQTAFPELTSGEREFIMTGITPAEWAKQFPE